LLSVGCRPSDAMRKLFGGLLGGKVGTRDVLKDVLEALAAKGVADDLWQKCLEAKDLEEVVEEEWPRDKLSELTANKAPLVFQLCARCATCVQAALSKHDDAGEELTDEAELALVNSILVLTQLLSAVPGPLQASSQQPDQRQQEHPLAAHLWTDRGSQGTLGERMIDSAMRLLFLEGFTIEEIEDSKPEKEEEDETEQPNPHKALVNGVQPAVLWCEGVGPEGGGPEKVGDDMRNNRQLCLQLLAALLCGAAPASPPAGSSDEAGPAATPGDRQRVADAVAMATLAGQEASRALMVEPRPLEYLCNPSKQVPRRGELLYSLLSVALGYDPHGYSVPYGGYFAGDKDELFTQLCLQILGLLLLDPNDVYVSGTEAVVSRRPQEQRGSWSTGAWLSPRPHVFRKMLDGISSAQEVNFVVSGVVTLLGTVSEERGTYLPKSMKVPKFLSELLVLVFHLAACDSFVASACREDDIVDLATGVLHVAAEAPEHMHDDTITLLIWSIVLRLTSHRDACVAFLEDFDGDVPDDLPEVSGTFVDVVFVAALKQLGDYFLTATCNQLHRSVLDSCLFCMINLSPFAEGISIETCHRFFALVERCGKSVQKRSSHKGAALLPYLLEILENSMQYQYTTNAHLAYGILARAGMLRALDKLVTQVPQVAADDTRTPSPTAALAMSPSRLAAVTNGSGGVGNLSPRTEVSDISTTPTSDETLTLWRRNVKVHLDPLMAMLEAALPQLEAAVEKKDCSSPDEAKELMPKSILGLMPPPPVFTTRSVASCEVTHRACEHCLVACLAHGPLADLWGGGADGEDQNDEVAQEERKKKIKSLAESAEKEEEASGGSPASFAPPPRGASSTLAAVGAAAAAVQVAVVAAAPAESAAHSAAEDDLTEDDYMEEEEEEEDLEGDELVDEPEGDERVQS